MENPILDFDLAKDEEYIEPRYAGFWIRTLASFLDGLIMLPLALFAIFSITYFKSLPLYLLSLIISAAYKPFFEYKLGATLGKMVIDLKVVGEDYKGISLQQSLIRSSPFLISSVASIIFIFLIDFSLFEDINGFFEFGTIVEASEYNWLNNLGNWPVFIACIVVAFDARKQGVHDKLAKTYCIYAK